MPTWRRLSATALASLTLPGFAAGAPPGPRAFREPIEAAAGTEAGLLVVTRAGVKVLDSTGQMIGGLDEAARPAAVTGPARRAGASPPLVGWPGLTGDADHSGAAVDPDDIDDADDPRFTDEGQARPWDIDEIERARRGGSAVPEPVSRRPLIAVADEDGWVVRANGLWRIELRSGAAIRVRTMAGARVRALAAGRAPTSSARGVPMLVLADGARLLASRDGGGTFVTLTGDASEIVAVVAGATGLIAGRERGGRLRAWRVGHPELAIQPPLPAATDDLAACETEILVLAGGNVYRLAVNDAAAAGGPRPGDGGMPVLVRAGPAPPGTERLACGAEGAGWVAFGDELRVSADGGRTWRARAGPSAMPVRAVIPTRGALWIAVAAGVWPLPAATCAPALIEKQQPVAQAFAGHGGPPAGGTSPLESWRRWHTLLPTVDIEFELGRFGPVRDVRGLISASFRLDGPATGGRPMRGSHRRPDAFRPRLADTAELDALATGAGDPIAGEERRALARILEEPP